MKDSIDLIKLPDENLGSARRFPPKGHTIVYNTSRDPDTIKHVDFYVNGTLVRREAKVPYALGGDTNGKFMPYNGDIYTIRVQVVDTNDKVVYNHVQKMDTLTFSNGRLELVDSTGRFLRVLNAISQIPSNPAIIYKPSNSSSESKIQSVRFYVNGKLVRSERNIPYSLGGDNGENMIRPYKGVPIENLKVVVVGDKNLKLQEITLEDDTTFICSDVPSGVPDERMYDTQRGKLYCSKPQVIENFESERSSVGEIVLPSIMIIGLLGTLVYRRYGSMGLVALLSAILLIVMIRLRKSRENYENSTPTCGRYVTAWVYADPKNSQGLSWVN